MSGVERDCTRLSDGRMLCRYADEKTGEMWEEYIEAEEFSDSYKEVQHDVEWLDDYQDSNRSEYF